MNQRLLVGFLAVMAIYAGAQDQSANEIAKELANPNTVLTSLKFKTQFRVYKGTLPQADDQNGVITLFQPTLPFPLKNGHTLYIRPTVPLIFDQPVFDQVAMNFNSGSGLGDIAFDLQYGDTSESGFLWSFGASTTLPTATKNGLGSERMTLGPGFQIGQLTKKSVLGVFVNHQWDVAGSGGSDISLTTLQFFGIYLPGRAWSVASSPIMSYNHETDEWTIPINIAAGKTVIIKGRPWKFALELNYYVKQPDAFGPKLMVGINISPVVVNRLADWF